MFRSKLIVGTLAAGLVTGCSDPVANSDDVHAPQMNVRQVPGVDNPGPPFYSLIQPGWFPMTDEYAAIAWTRETHCVPGNFDILTLLDLTILFPPQVPFPGPRPFFCPLTVTGHEIWNTDPPDPAVGPLNVTIHGLGAVPVWFVSTSEVMAEINSDGNLTIAELESMSSLLIGYADRFTLTQQTGTAHGRPGEGKIVISAKGLLEDGRTFLFQTSEGPPRKPEIAHTRIEFR
jgi:hypothetical protein